MLSCKDVTKKANAYLDGELGFSARVSVRMHLFICVNCRRYVKQLQTTILALGKMEKTPDLKVEEKEIAEIVNMLKHARKDSADSKPGLPE